MKEVSGVCDEDVTALFARRSPEAYDDLGVWTLPEYFLPHRERCGTVKPLTHGLSPSAAAATAAMDALCSPSDMAFPPIAISLNPLYAGVFGCLRVC